jgi:hypothetical protein
MKRIVSIEHPMLYQGFDQACDICCNFVPIDTKIGNMFCFKNSLDVYRYKHATFYCYDCINRRFSDYIYIKENVRYNERNLIRAQLLALWYISAPRFYYIFEVP